MSVYFELEAAGILTSRQIPGNKLPHCSSSSGEEVARSDNDDVVLLLDVVNAGYASYYIMYTRAEHENICMFFLGNQTYC